VEKLEKLCSDIYTYLDDVINKLKKGEELSEETHIQNNVHEQLKQMWLEMSASIKGLENLRYTYKNDAGIESRLDLCMDKIKGYISDISHALYSKESGSKESGSGNGGSGGGGNENRRNKGNHQK
jgi:DNA mismatch repair ATPase MutS